MTTAGWIVMLSSIATVILFMLWCIRKILSTPGESEHIHGIENPTPDTEEGSSKDKE
jgi:hypothetical protein